MSTEICWSLQPEGMIYKLGILALLWQMRSDGYDSIFLIKTDTNTSSCSHCKVPPVFYSCGPIAGFSLSYWIIIFSTVRCGDNCGPSAYPLPEGRGMRETRWANRFLPGWFTCTPLHCHIKTHSALFKETHKREKPSPPHWTHTMLTFKSWLIVIQCLSSFNLVLCKIMKLDL